MSTQRTTHFDGLNTIDLIHLESHDTWINQHVLKRWSLNEASVARVCLYCQFNIAKSFEAETKSRSRKITDQNQSNSCCEWELSNVEWFSWFLYQASSVSH